MSGQRGPAVVLLALCAAAVVALVVAVQLYDSLLPAESEASSAAGAVGVVGIGLLVALVAAAVWLLRGRRPAAQPDLDRRLWETVVRAGEEAPPEDERAPGGPPQS